MKEVVTSEVVVSFVLLLIVILLIGSIANDERLQKKDLMPVSNQVMVL